MPKFPNKLVLPTGLITISPYSLESTGAGSGSWGAPASAVWASASRAIYIPFRISKPIAVVNLYCFNGAVVNGNIDLGIYDVAGTRIVSTGSTAQAVINSLQAVAITSTVIGPGMFYMAIALDGTVGTIFTSRAVGAIPHRIAMGMAQQAAAFPLPATATFATITDNSLPVAGLSRRSVV